jgi:hypothetical protein
MSTDISKYIRQIYKDILKKYITMIYGDISIIEINDILN